MTKRAVINLFATKADWGPGVLAAEATRQLQYLLCGLFATPDLVAWDSLLRVESLGQCSRPDHVAGFRYLVMDSRRPVAVRRIPQRRGGVKYAVDQLENPGSMTILPGGLFETSCLLAGQMGTVVEDEEALALFRDYSRAVTKGFSRVGGYLVGPEALALASGGVRLTTSARSPREYDLKP